LNKIHVSKRCINVTFQIGARTTLDSHESDQLLIVTQGRGVIGLINGNSIKEFKIEDYDVLLLENIGDTVCIPSNKLHFHGEEGRGFFAYCRKEIIQGRRINPICNKSRKQMGV